MGLFKKLIASIKESFLKKKKKRRIRKSKKRTVKTHRRAKTSIRKPFQKKVSKKRRTVKKSTRKKSKRKVKKVAGKISGKLLKRQKSVKKRPKNKSKTQKISKPTRSRTTEAQGVIVGEVTHYFSKIKVCVIKINSGSIFIGDKIQIKGNSSDCVEIVKSLQIENEDVKAARKGQLVGLKIAKRVREGDKVYKIKA